MPNERKTLELAERPEGLQDFAYRHIVQAIMTGELGPGEKVSPSRLATTLRISHIPVREALASLEYSGYVVREPRVGYFVAELSTDNLEDIYHWRQVLEDEAHRAAIQKLDSSDFERMRKINRASSKLPVYGAKSLALNREFHFVPFERAGSEILLFFLNRLWDASLRYQSASAIPIAKNTLIEAAARSALIQSQHESLIAALIARDIKLVNKVMSEHRGVTVRGIRAMLDRKSQ